MPEVCSPCSAEQIPCGLKGKYSPSLRVRTFKTWGLRWETRVFLLCKPSSAALASALLFSAVTFGTLQMVEVADGGGRARLSGTAVASHRSCYDPERLSFLCGCLFGLFGLGFLNTLFVGKTRRKGGLASWQLRLSSRGREERMRAITSLLTFNTGLEILWLCT